MERQAQIERKTRETDVTLSIDLDGHGKSEISTGIPFFDHMLSLMAMHGLFDMSLRATGDLEVDFHHTVEDIGIALGEAVRRALGDASGIRRFGGALVPMDEALTRVVVDISGRPYLVYRVKATGRVKDFDIELVESFFKAMADHGRLTLHIELLYGKNLHHIVESIFKGFGRALGQASSLDERVVGIPSTKGRL